MEKELIEQYQAAMDVVKRLPETGDVSPQDILQRRLEYLLKNPDKIEKYQDKAGYFKKSLLFCVKMKRIDTFQSHRNVISLSEKEVMETLESEGYMIHLDLFDTDLRNYVLNYSFKNGKNLFSEKERSILELRIDGYTAKEIAVRLDATVKAIQKAIERIDSKLLRIPLGDVYDTPYYRGPSLAAKR